MLLRESRPFLPAVEEGSKLEMLDRRGQEEIAQDEVCDELTG